MKYTDEQHIERIISYREAHSEVPWAKISGLRHRLVHNYEDTNWNIISDIIFNILPEFQKQLREIKNGTTEEK